MIVRYVYGNMVRQVFKEGIKKPDRLLDKNQHNQRKLLCFVNICGRSPDLSKTAKCQI